MMSEMKEDVVLKDSAWYQKILKEIGQKLDESEKRTVIVALDGPCASGKTTIARLLEQDCDCNVFHMDDFFLRPEQRTPERLAEIGGNVDYERFCAEILQPVLVGRSVRFRPYVCSRQMLGEKLVIPAKRLNIVEGSYSLHPYFGHYYDLAYCLTIDPEVQKSRILKRNGEAMLSRFVNEWIPKENAYLEKFGIAEAGTALVLAFALKG